MLEREHTILLSMEIQLTSKLRKILAGEVYVHLWTGNALAHVLILAMPGIQTAWKELKVVNCKLKLYTLQMSSVNHWEC